MNTAQITQIKDLAKKAAKLFVEEFGCPLDTASTDWDSEAWNIDCSQVDDLDEATDKDEAWPLYRDALVAETERLIAQKDSEGDYDQD